MAEKEETQEEMYSGSEFDTIEIPDESKTVISDQDESIKEETKQQESHDQKGPDETETKEERRQRKHNDYQKRLNELVRQRHEAEERAAAQAARAELLEQRLAETLKGASESTASILKQREQDLIEKRREAEESGNLAEYSKVSDELFSVRANLRPQPSEKERSKETYSENPGNRQDRSGIVPEAEEWLGKNEWFSKPENSHLAAEVERIEMDLIRRGYRLDNPSHAKKVYEEIDRRIRDLPEFDDVLGVREETKDDNESNKRSHIAPPSRGGEAPARKKPGELSDRDIFAIKMAGLDHKDPKVRDAYMKRKRA